MTFYICRFNVLGGGGGDSIGILRPCPDINPSVSAEFLLKKNTCYYYMYSRDRLGPSASCFKLRPVVDRFLEHLRNLKVQCNNYRHAY